MTNLFLFARMGAIMTTPVMKQRRSYLRDLLRNIGRSSMVWATVGTPVAAVVAAFRVFVWVVFSLPEMIVTAAVLGAAQGLWMHIAGSADKKESVSRGWFGLVTGGILGILGFPPVFSRIDGIVADRLLVLLALLAAFCGGMAAGWVSAKVMTFSRSRAALGRAVLVGCVLVPSLAAVDYHFFWAPTFDRLPVPMVSHRDVANFHARDARGTTWAGCYQYLGHLTRGSGVLGGEGGNLEVQQADGALKVSDGDAGLLLGAVGSDRRFRFGVERNAGENTLRVLWEGKFNGADLDFTRRTTVLRGTRIINTTRLIGTAQRVSCHR